MRATAVHGVFHIVALFWEVIPAHVVKELVNKIVSFENSEDPYIKTFINYQLYFCYCINYIYFVFVD